MKNSQKNLKNRSILLAVGALVCASLLMLVSFFLSCLSVSAQQVVDEFSGWVDYPTKSVYLYNQYHNFTVSVAEESLAVPFDFQYVSSDDLQLTLGLNGGAITGLVSGIASNEKVYLSMHGQIDTQVPVKITFPDTLYHKYISGSVVVPVRYFYDDGTPDISFYRRDGLAWTYGSGTKLDETKRWSLSGTGSGEGYSYSVVPTNTDGYYHLIVNFDDYLINGGGFGYMGKMVFDLDFHFSFDLVAYDQTIDLLGSGSELSPISACVAHLQPRLYDPECKVGIVAPSFYLSNEYYAILNALENSSIGDHDGNIDTYTQLIYSNLNSLNSLLTGWLQNPQTHAVVNWSVFATEVYSYLGSISQYLDGLSDDNSDLYSLIQDIGSDVSLCATLLSGSNTHLQYIYRLLRDGGHTYDESGDYVNTGDFSSLLAGLYLAFTGDNMDIYTNEDGDIYTSITGADVRSYNRWVDIIEAALTSVVIENEDLQDLSDDIITDDNYIHLYLEDQWDEIFTNIPNRQWWVDKATAPTAVLATAGWWVSVLDYVYAHLGVFIFVVNTILTVGILMIVLGKINQISKATSRKA